MTEKRKLRKMKRKTNPKHDNKINKYINKQT